MLTNRSLLTVILSIILAFSQALFALDKPADELTLVVPREKLGQTINLDLEFKNSAGDLTKIGSYFDGEKPVIVVPGYLTCPRVCGAIFQGVAQLINQIKLDFGKEYKVLVVSFDHEDTSLRAKEKKAEFFEKLIIENPDQDSWRFLVGNKDNIRELMEQLGFRYLKDGEEFAHSAALYVLTPDGKISQYFSGVSFNSFDVKLALLEAADGKVGTFLDQALVYCFRFDPTKGQYVWIVNGALKIGGALTLVFLGLLMFCLWKKEFFKKKSSNN